MKKVLSIRIYLPELTLRDFSGRASPDTLFFLTCDFYEGAELHNVNFFTQIISVKLNLPQEKSRKLLVKFLTFKVLNGYKKQILGQTYQKLHLEDCFEEKCHCRC